MTDTTQKREPSLDAAIAKIERENAVRVNAELLRRHRFDPALFAGLQAEAAALQRTGSGAPAGELDPAQFAPLRPEDIYNAASYDVADALTLYREGESLIRRGELAVLVWAGGMATRFGGVVKACVEALPDDGGLTFLGAKARDVKRARDRFGGRIGFAVMTSFATDDAIRAELAAKDNYGLPAEDVFVFSQSVLLRLTPEGKVFAEANAEGAPEASLYAPGHGDFFRALRDSGTLAALRGHGVSLIAASNVDNLGALVDPQLLAITRNSGKAMMAEVTRARAGEKGASAVRFDGEVRLVEYVRLPKGMALADALLNTNNLYFEAAAIDRPIPLPFFPVTKQIHGKSALQFEQITCEVCAVRSPSGGALLPLGLIEVEREGEKGRFYPVKEPSDLEQMRPALRERLRAAWATPQVVP